MSLLTVADVLRLDVLDRAAPEVVAGETGLTNPVRWVHVTELADIAHLVKGGELLLTTGMGFGDDPATRRQYLDELADVGISGLVVELGRTWDRLPDDVVDQAQSRGLPLIVLHREARFIDITEEVHAGIINWQYELLTKAEKVSREFTRLVLQGSPADRLVAQLSISAENPVVFEDAVHQVIEHNAYAHPIDEIIGNWSSHSWAPHRPREDDDPVEFHDGDVRCARIAVRVRDETWGWLHVLEVDAAIDALHLLALDRAATAVGMTLLSERNATQLAATARGALIADILQARYGSGDEIVRRAKALGANFENRMLFALEVEPTLASFVAEHGLTERDRHQLRNRLLRVVTDVIASSKAVGISGLDGDRVLSLLGLSTNRPGRKLVDVLAREIEVRIGEVAEGLQLVIGVSRRVSTSSLHRGFEEATEAVRFGMRTQAKGVQYFDDLGFHQLLLRLPDADLARFTESELAPILEHDANSSSPLLETLCIYLRSGGNKSAAAKMLCIERRSLYHRLDRIVALLGRDIDDPEHTTRLMLAIRSLELLDQR